MIDQTVAMLGVPMDLGGGRRGVDMGPNAMRIAGLVEGVQALGIEIEDLGNVPVSEPERRVPKDPKARFAEEIAECCARLAGEVEGVLDRGSFPLVIGGDHSIAAGTVAGMSNYFHKRQERMGLIWFDAHGDMNTPESSTSGNVHGMPLAACLGRGVPQLVALGQRHPMVDPACTALIGVRDLDRREALEVREAGIRVFTLREIDMHGIHKVMSEAIEIATGGTVGFHLSFDLDGVDPSAAPGVGTPVPGGTTLRESHLVMEHAAASGKLLGLEIAELNPIIDDHNRTAEFAKELILSGLGKAVL
jgi:arginase